MPTGGAPLRGLSSGGVAEVPTMALSAATPCVACSEFMAEFETACQGRGIALFVLSIRSPKLNGTVERASRTHTEEFYEVSEAEPELADRRAALSAWETTYNTVRPHQALGYLTLPSTWPRWRPVCTGRAVPVQGIDRAPAPL